MTHAESGIEGNGGVRSAIVKTRKRFLAQLVQNLRDAEKPDHAQ